MAKDQYQNLQMLDLLRKRCLVMPVSSVLPERVLIADGGTISANYNRLHPDKANVLMFRNRAQSRNLVSYSYSYPRSTHT